VPLVCSDETHEYFPLLLDGESDEVGHASTMGGGGSDAAVDGGDLGGSSQVACMRFLVSVTLRKASNTLLLSDNDVIRMTELAQKVRLLAVRRLLAARDAGGLNNSSCSGSTTSESSSSDSEDDVMLCDLAMGVTAASAGTGGAQLGAHSAAPTEHGTCCSSDTCDSGDELHIMP
jgi:hypothetical protein